MRKLLECAKGHKLKVVALILLAILAPINHIFFHDTPNNPLQRIENFIIQNILGINIDIGDLEGEWKEFKEESKEIEEEH